MKNTLLALSMAVALTGLFTQCQSSGNKQQPAEQTALIPIPQTVTYAETAFNPSLIVNLCFSLLLSILQFSFAPLCTTNFFLF